MSFIGSNTPHCFLMLLTTVAGVTRKAEKTRERGQARITRPKAAENIAPYFWPWRTLVFVREMT